MSVRIEPPSVTAKNAYRFGSFGLAIIVAVAALTVRMFDLQVIQGQGSYSITQGQSAETISVPSSRGLIYRLERDIALVQNIPNFVVEIIPENLPVADKAVVVRRLASLLNMDTADIDQELDSATGSMYDPVEIASNVDTDVARIIDENVDLLPGVQVISQPLRQYTNAGFKQSALQHDPGLHGHAHGRPQRRPEGRRLLAERCHRAGRPRGRVRKPVARHARQGDGRPRQQRPAHPRVDDDHHRSRSRGLADSDHQQSRPVSGLQLPPVGDQCRPT